MISQDVLKVAVERGVLDTDQVTRLNDLAREMAAQAAEEPDDPEKLRFVAGFSDIFVTIGLLLFTGGIAYLAQAAADDVGMWLAVAASTWALTEFFTRRRRMALPSIVLLILFSLSAFGALNWLIALGGGHRPSPGFLGLGLDTIRPLGTALAAFLTTLAVAVHYWRFRVPITVGAGAAALVVAAVYFLTAAAPEFTETYLNWIILMAGLIVFAVGMRFDLSDPARATRRTDIAFWLHLLAAPLVVHPLVGSPLGGARLLDSATAFGVLAIFLALGAVAVIIDRRAMLASGLIYAGVAFERLIRQTGLTDQIVPLTLLAVGAFVLLLSAGWRPVRKALLALLPDRLARALPHPSISA